MPTAQAQTKTQFTRDDLAKLIHAAKVLTKRQKAYWQEQLPNIPTEFQEHLFQSVSSAEEQLRKIREEYKTKKQHICQKFLQETVHFAKTAKKTILGKMEQISIQQDEQSEEKLLQELEAA